MTEQSSDDRASSAVPTSPDASVSVAFIQPEGDSQVVTVRGEVDAYSAHQLRSCLLELVESGQRQVVVDVKDMAFIDSNGLGVLVASAKRLRQRHGVLKLRQPNRHTAKLLEITGLKGLVSVD